MLLLLLLRRREVCVALSAAEALRGLLQMKGYQIQLSTIILKLKKYSIIRNSLIDTHADISALGLRVVRRLRVSRLLRGDS